MTPREKECLSLMAPGVKCPSNLEIAQAMKIARGVAKRYVQQLEGRGVIRVHRYNNSRTVTFTRTGLTTLGKLPAIEQFAEDIANGMDVAEAGSAQGWTAEESQIKFNELCEGIGNVPNRW